MIFGLRRGLAALACLALSLNANGQMFEKNHVIPETVDAIDLNTGAPYYAPPVPRGHYTKDTLGHLIGSVHGAAAQAHGAAAHVANAVKSLCSTCGGSGACAGCGSAAGTPALGTCGSCGGKGYILSDGSGPGHNHAGGDGHTHIAHAGSGGTVIGGTTGGHGLLGGHGAGNGNGAGAGYGAPVVNGHFAAGAKSSPQIAPSGQYGSPQAVASCGNGGCGGKVCGEPTCFGLFGGKGRGNGGGCGTPGCSAPGCGNGGGLFAGHGGGGHGGAGGCGTPGCNTCGNGGMGGHGMGGHPAGPCGMPGCGICASLMNAHKGLLAKAAGLFGKHHGPKWFTGPGGPVPLTPGYVQYVNPVRSPRDYFAFPPYLDQAMSPGYGSMPQSTAGFATDRATTPTEFVTPPPARTAPVPPPPPRGESLREVPPASRTLRERMAPTAPAPASENEN